MSTITDTVAVEISGRQYTISKLNVDKCNKVLEILARKGAFQFYAAPEEAEEDGISITMGHMLDGRLADADISALTAIFGPHTVVDLGMQVIRKPDGETVEMSQVTRLDGASEDSKRARETLWAGQVDDQYAWLDACIRANFASSLKKVRTVLEKRAAELAKQRQNPQPT